MGLTEARALVSFLRDGPHICNEEGRDFSCLVVKSSPPAGKKLEAVLGSTVHYVCWEREKGEVKSFDRSLCLGPEVSLSLQSKESESNLAQRQQASLIIADPHTSTSLFDILYQSQLF